MKIVDFNLCLRIHCCVFCPLFLGKKQVARHVMLPHGFLLNVLHRCFLLTPKLLPNLEYSEACSILTVMNGPWIEESSKGWMLLQAKATVVPFQFRGAYLLAFLFVFDVVWSSGECWGSVMGLMGASLWERLLMFVYILFCSCCGFVNVFVPSLVHEAPTSTGLVRIVYM